MTWIEWILLVVCGAPYVVVWIALYFRSKK